MSLLRTRRGLVEALERGDWSSEAERDQLLDAARKQALKAVEVLPLLDSAEPRVRQLGSELFLASADPAAARRLFQTLGGRPPHLRAYGQRLLLRLPEPVLQPLLDELVKSPDARQAREGWDLAMAVQGPSRPRWLERAAAQAPGPLRLRALEELLRLGQLKDLRPLLEAARSDDPGLALLAIRALEGQDGPEVAELMIDRLAHGQGEVRERAVAWLRGAARARPLVLRPRLLALLSEGEDSTRRLCVELLFSTGEPAEVVLLVLDYARDLVGWLRTRILDTLQTFGEDVLRPAVQLLQHEDETIRTNALVLAERFDDPRLVGPVCRMLQDPDWWLRITACDTLARLKDERALPFLVRALEDEDTRWAAIDALGRIGSVQALKPLTGLLRDRREEVRLEVVAALAHFPDRRLLPLLQQVREKDPSGQVRTRAAEVLRELSERLELSFHGEEAPTGGLESARQSRALDRLLAAARAQGASDIHISVGEPPFLRSDGRLVRAEGHEPLSAEQTEAWLFELLNPRQAQRARAEGELDFCHAIPEIGRYRTNLYLQRKGWCAAFRVIPNTPPTMGDLRIPGQLVELLDYHQGIIVVSGPSGSGKSTTLAALINLINESRPTHVITLEDPIEFVHPIKLALVNQREVGTHTESFARALRGALREDPDVIMVGEMRDPETIRMSLEAAETGHLVIATMHTTSAVQTIERLVKAFPPDEQPQVRMSLSESLKFVISQSLLPRKDGKGRVAVFEVLKGTLSVGNLIRDNKSFQIPSLMQIGRRQGMQTRDMGLLDLVQAGLVAAEEAWLRADQPANFEHLCSAAFLERMRADLAESPSP